jgi:hypothetical protein
MPAPTDVKTSFRTFVRRHKWGVVIFGILAFLVLASLVAESVIGSLIKAHPVDINSSVVITIDSNAFTFPPAGDEQTAQRRTNILLFGDCAVVDETHPLGEAVLQTLHAERLATGTSSSGESALWCVSSEHESAAAKYADDIAQQQAALNETVRSLIEQGRDAYERQFVCPIAAQALIFCVTSRQAIVDAVLKEHTAKDCISAYAFQIASDSYLQVSNPIVMPPSLAQTNSDKCQTALVLSQTHFSGSLAHLSDQIRYLENTQRAIDVRQAVEK